MGDATAQLVDRRFVILRRLGRGGMASAYQAYDCRQGRRVVLKAIEEAGAWRPDHPVVQEFEAWSGMNHPGIVRAHELQIAVDGPLQPGMPYLVLEEVVGDSIERTLPRSGWRVSHLRRLAVELLDALSHLHGRGWVHRDIKPANVLQAPDGRVLLTDFGLAVRHGHRDKAGMLSGSLPYAAPESLLGRPVNSRSDLFSLGILLCRLAAGERWTPISTEQTLVHYILGRPLPDLDRTLQSLNDPGLSKLVTRLLMFDPDDRPKDADAARELLGGCRRLQDREPGTVADLSGPLRLRLDRTRLGDRRRIRIDLRRRDEAQRLFRSWCPAFSLPYIDLAMLGFVDRRETWFEGIAELLRMLDFHPTTVERLPLLRLGDRWIVDHCGHFDRFTAGAVAEAILAIADRVPIIWHVPHDFNDGFSRAVLRRLHRECGAKNGPRARGGLLLVQDVLEDSLQELAV